MASEIRVNKIINRSGLSTVTFTDDGAIVSGIVTANSFSGNVTGNITGNVTGNVTGAVTGSGANLTSIPAGQLTGTVADARLSTVSSSKLSGALPAIDGSNLTGVGASFGNSSVNTSGIITATSFVPTVGQLSNRNLIINGAMKVSQRHGTSATTTSNAYVLDRFSFYHNVTNAVTSISQSTDNPGNGFTHSMKVDVTTAGTPGATQHANINYNIEGQDLGHIDNGAATAKKLTLSFWVKSPKTGNHAVGLYKAGNTTRQTTKTYSVSSANTWEKKTITYDGDTAGGGLLITNGFGIGINFFLAAGSSMTGTDSTSWVNYSNAAYCNGHAVNCLDNAANDFYLTGVQLEVGSVATPFEHRSFGEELYRCQRYFELLIWEGYGFYGYQPNGNAVEFQIRWNVEKRANPSITLPATGTGSGQIGPTNTAGSNMSGGSLDGPFTIKKTTARISGGGWSGGSSGAPCALYSGGSPGAIIKISSEL